MSETTQPVNNRKMILVVDDDPMLIELQKQILDMLGYKVIAETSSVRALNLLKTTPEAFDLIITDYSMPEINGLEFIKHAADINCKVPIIILSGYEDVEKNVRSSGFNDVKFLSKPTSIEKISKAVTESFTDYIEHEPRYSS